MMMQGGKTKTMIMGSVGRREKAGRRRQMMKTLPLQRRIKQGGAT